jgi:biopolymer transport protein ExbD
MIGTNQPRFVQAQRRVALIATLLLAIAQVTMAQNASQDADAPVLTIGLSADGICHIADISFPCDQLGPQLASRHLAPNGQVHISVDPNAKYQIVAAFVESLRGAGIKIGFVQSQPSK